MEIWATTVRALSEAVDAAHIDPKAIAGVGITNQRETAILWDRRTGQPVYNAIVWQCRRTAPLAEQLIVDGYEEEIRAKTGLTPDPYFSGTKIRWILDNVSGAHEAAEAGELMFGTIDTCLSTTSPAGLLMQPTTPTRAVRCSSTSIRSSGTKICWGTSIFLAP